ncbi:MAG: threonine synthase, partial [Leifsonia sp.]
MSPTQQIRESRQWRGVIREYADRLDVTDATPVVTLGEGGTPLLPAPALSARTGAQVWVKFEGMNPTGSFKDRGMTMAVTKGIEAGAKAIICASTGNTSASAAAYAAHAGITAAVLVPEGKIAMGKLSQAVAHNGRLLQVRGNFDDCLEIARELAANYPVHLVNSVNNDRIEGQKTAAFEVVEVLRDAPDFHIVPVGNAGNYTAYHRGYTEELQRGVTTKLP